MVLLVGTETSDAARRRQAVVAEIRDSGVAMTEFEVHGRPRLAEIEAVAAGDWVSCYLAIAEGLDPTPVDTIDRYKARLPTD
jgi:glucose/mannose-6-phosphate isomerase